MAKILLIAPSLDANDVGEAWVGYQWASRLSDRHDVTVLTYRDHGRESAKRQVPGARVVEWSQPKNLGAPGRFNSLLKPWYPLFYRACRKWVREAQAHGNHFDLAHQPLPVAMRYPTPLAGMGIPYVLGPVGGGLPSPPGFRSGDTAPWYVGLRRMDSWRLRHDPLLRRSFTEASIVLGIAPYVRDSLEGLPIRKFRVMSETGIDLMPGEVVRKGSSMPLRLLFVGRLIRTKGTRDAIAAMAQLRDLPLHLDIVGDGFDRRACEELARNLELSERVTFHGSVPRQAVDEFYRRADIFVFPSYREPGGNAPFEAMSWALPLVVADRGGPGNVVDESFGMLVSPTSPRQYATDIALAVRLLATDHGLRLSMGEAARRRASQSGTWDSRVEQIEQVYAEIMGRSGKS